MTFADWVKLSERAEKCGNSDDPLLAQLLHIIQFKEVVIESHRQTMSKLNVWENNIARGIERHMEEADDA